MQESTVTSKIENKICTIFLNREKSMNSINIELLSELKNLIESLRFSNEIRVIIITGTGDKAFCAGADLKERITLSELQVKQFIYEIRTTMNLIANYPKPIIAAINGVALGGGTELSLACDIRIASNTAKMGLTETKLAIIPGAGGTQRLPRLVGYGVAKELIFTGRMIDANEALSIGLINKITEPNELLSEAYKMAEMICNNAPIAVEQAKKAINRGCEVDIETGLVFESEAYQACIPTLDRLEGLKAFSEKRKPEYKGN
ncbi:MAG: enoyl-CoA hydratase [Candidatus Sericytochromatia bacterium]|nr:enoyl-CoA hydratase [Candidatus Sericytochromatia bacterium]